MVSILMISYSDMVPAELVPAKDRHKYTMYEIVTESVNGVESSVMRKKSGYDSNDLLYMLAVMKRVG